jgi:hypothetical protein
MFGFTWKQIAVIAGIAILAGMAYPFVKAKLFKAPATV